MHTYGIFFINYALKDKDRAPCIFQSISLHKLEFPHFSFFKAVFLIVIIADRISTSPNNKNTLTFLCKTHVP